MFSSGKSLVRLDQSSGGMKGGKGLLPQKKKSGAPALTQRNKNSHRPPKKPHPLKGPAKTKRQGERTSRKHPGPGGSAGGLKPSVKISKEKSSGTMASDLVMGENRLTKPRGLRGFPKEKWPGKDPGTHFPLFKETQGGVPVRKERLEVGSGVVKGEGRGGAQKIR